MSPRLPFEDPFPWRILMNRRGSSPMKMEKVVKGISGWSTRSRSADPVRMSRGRRQTPHQAWNGRAGEEGGVRLQEPSSAVPLPTRPSRREASRTFRS